MGSTDRTAALLQTLTDGIAALTSSTRWRDWLSMQSRFHSYSFPNVLLITSQDPLATQIAGFRTWHRLGRRVRAGEHGIWIMAPITRATAPDGQQPAVDGASTPVRTLTGFKAVPVFDVRQTDGEPLPDVATRLTGDAPGCYDRLVTAAHGHGYTVTREQLPSEVNGDCTFSTRRIRTEVRNAEAQQVKTLAHELAHALLHEHCADRSLAELEAESVAFVVCGTLGVQTGEYSFGYVAGWAGGGDDAITAIRTSGVRIQGAAARILTAAQGAP